MPCAIERPALVCSVATAVGLCLYVDDGICDEPDIGTGLCPEGTDPFDCEGTGDTFDPTLPPTTTFPPTTTSPPTTTFPPTTDDSITITDTFTSTDEGGFTTSTGGRNVRELAAPPPEDRGLLCSARCSVVC